jgi:UDP-N-acetylglucosamine/UDP-N-acetylgalactosamine diphosphorylase
MKTIDEAPTVQALLESVGQSHVLKWWNELDADQQAVLSGQIAAIDWPGLQRLVNGEEDETDWAGLARRAVPPEAVDLAQQRDPVFRRAAYAAGSGALRAGEVAFLLTAGGQGTRLGFDQAKGLYPIGPVSGRTLFQIMLDHARARGRRYGVSIPVYIMTSPQTDAEVRRFLRDQNWFGYPEQDVRVFCQGVMPAVGRETGRVLMSDRHEIFTNPDGHGGALDALRRHGLLDDMRARGVRQVFYGQIDNPLLQVCDPVLIGGHLRQGSEVTTQVVRKREALQKVGNVVSVDGVTRIIEYSDLPEEFARRKDAAGNLVLWAGSIAVHVFSLDFLVRAATEVTALPFHRAVKPIPHVDEAGRAVNPVAPNGVKFERFIFDLLPAARKSLVWEVDPAEGFAALKNAPPATTETADWVRAAMSGQFRKWIEQSGCRVAAGVPVEIHPCFALDAEELKGRLEPGQRFDQPVWLE